MNITEVGINQKQAELEKLINENSKLEGKQASLE